MNKDKLSLVSGFMPSLALAVLLGFEYAAQNGYIKIDLSLYGLTTAAAFLLPFIIILLLMRGSEGAVYRFKGFKPRFFSFVVLMSITLSLMSFLLNWLAAFFSAGGFTVQSSAAVGDSSILQLMLISIFLPALCEEFFFRGGLMPALEGGGLYSAMVVSALSFALVHGDISNILGPFAAGLIYGYMTYITGSVWAAVLAHFINNSMTFAINYLLVRYSAVGLWQYFVIFVFAVFFVFLYLSMGRLERLVEKGRVPRIKRVGFAKGVSSAFFSPGIWVLIVMFMLKTFYLQS